MTLSSLLVQLMNGLAEASTLFLVAAGLSLIFGVTRIVNFAHGSFHMLGIYLAYTLIAHSGGGPGGFWGAVLLAALGVALLGALVEIVILRRLYGAPELLQLLATFALVLIVKDAVLWLWGAEDLFAPRAPGLAGAVLIAGQRLGQYDVLLIFLGPLILGLMWLLLNRSHWGTLIRAATQDREMLAALGVNQAWLFTGVFALGCFLAGLGGALQSPRVPATLTLDLDTLGNAFVVVVVGGMGSLGGAFLAALLIAAVKALCVALGTVTLGTSTIAFSKLTLVVEFLVMVIVLVWRPWGLCGKPQAIQRERSELDLPLQPTSRWQRRGGWLLGLLLIALPVLSSRFPYLTVLLVEILIAILFAASLHFIMGPGGMHSFGHAAYFGVGAYAAALVLLRLHQPMLVALAAGPLFGALAASLFGWFCVRLSGVYLAMLTLAFAQITWAIVFQWDDFTGGSNGLIGIWPAEWAASPLVFYYLALAASVLGILLLRRVVFAPFGLALRATRDAAARAETIGIDGRRTQWLAFILAGAVCGLAGALFAFSKGSISPDALSIGHSVDGLVMVMLGGIQSLFGPVVGAALFTWLQDLIAQETDYWRALLGLTMLALVLLFPGGLMAGLFARFGKRESA